MATIDDIGVSGQPLNNPPLTAWQAAVRDKLNAHDGGDTWNTYLPTPTNFTIQSSLMRYQVTPGGLVTISGQITIATMSTSPSFSLPPGLTSGVVLPLPFMITQTGSTLFPGIAYLGGGVALYCYPTTAGGAVRPITATAPFTWKAGDLLHFAGTYRAA